jgi:hypothetical protein
MNKTKTGGLNSPMTSVKVGVTPKVASNTFVSDIAITQPRNQKNSGTSLAITK